MAEGDDEDDVMSNALRGVTDGPLYVAHELRLMAQAAPPYTRFTYMSPMIRNVWHAAADFLEQAYMGAKH